MPKGQESSWGRNKLVFVHLEYTVWRYVLIGWLAEILSGMVKFIPGVRDNAGSFGQAMGKFLNS